MMHNRAGGLSDRKQQATRSAQRPSSTANEGAAVQQHEVIPDAVDGERMAPTTTPNVAAPPKRTRDDPDVVVNSERKTPTMVCLKSMGDAVRDALQHHERWAIPLTDNQKSALAQLGQCGTCVTGKSLEEWGKTAETGDEHTKLLYPILDDVCEAVIAFQEGIRFNRGELWQAAERKLLLIKAARHKTDYFHLQLEQMIFRHRLRSDPEVLALMDKMRISSQSGFHDKHEAMDAVGETNNGRVAKNVPRTVTEKNLQRGVVMTEFMGHIRGRSLPHAQPRRGRAHVSLAPSHLEVCHGTETGQETPAHHFGHHRRQSARTSSHPREQRRKLCSSR